MYVYIYIYIHILCVVYCCCYCYCYNLFIIIIIIIIVIIISIIMMMLVTTTILIISCLFMDLLFNQSHPTARWACRYFCAEARAGGGRSRASPDSIGAPRLTWKGSGSARSRFSTARPRHRTRLIGTSSATRLFTGSSPSKCTLANAF